MSKRILVPVDGSDQAKSALKEAVELFSDEELIVFHVINESSLDYVNSMITGPEQNVGEQIEHGVENEARDLVDRAVDIAQEHGVDATGEIARGTPAQTIIEYAEENDIDHIVMGSHGYTRVARRWFGSVADRVVKGAPVTVTIVR